MKDFKDNFDFFSVSRPGKNDVISGFKGSNIHIHTGLDWNRNEKYLSITDESYPVGDPRRNVFYKSWSIFQPSPIDGMLRENPAVRREIDGLNSAFNIIDNLLDK